MKKNTIIQTLLWGMILLAGSCIGDDGNYDYLNADDVFPVKITGLQKSVTVSQGSVLKLTPIIENDDPSQYTYSWVATEAQTAGKLPERYDIAETRDLDYTVTLDVGSYLLNFKVYDKAKDVFRRYEINLTVSASPVGPGWYILKDNGQETDFDFINNDGTMYTDLLAAAGNRPKGIARNMEYQNGRYYHVEYDADGKATTLVNQTAFYVTTDQDIRTYNAKTLKLFKTFKEQFYSAPETVDPVSVYYLSSGTSFLMNDKKIYSIYGMSSNIGKFTAAKVGIYSLYDGFMSCGTDNMMVFDELSHTFYKVGSMSTQLSQVPELPNGEEEPISFADMPYDIVCMGTNTNQYSGYSYVVMKSLETDEGAIGRVQAIGGGFDSFKKIPAGNKLLQAKLVAPSFTADFLYFTIAGENKVYAYENAEGAEEKVILEYPAGESIAFMKHVKTNDINVLAVLTDTATSWKLYLYDLIGESNPEINPTPRATYEGTETGRYIMYRR